MDVEIRNAGIGDLEALQYICRQTFEESYAWCNTFENMKQYLTGQFSVGQLTLELNSPDTQFFMLYKDSSLIGYLKLKFGTNRLGITQPDAMEIERIYVLKHHHGTGMGQLLYNEAMRIALQNHIAVIWLGVWEKNPRAIAFYTKNNFTPVGKQIFKLGNDDQTDFVMELIINN